MIEIVSIAFSALATLLVTVCGWFLNRTIQEHDETRDKSLVMFAQLTELDKKHHRLVDIVMKNDDDTIRSAKDLDIRMQFAESRHAVIDTRMDNQAKMVESLAESLVDIRDNMVRRIDLDALVAQINRRRGK